MLELSPRRLGRAVCGASAVVALFGLAAEVMQHTWAAAPRALVTLLSLSFEGNLPTWYSGVLLFSCGLLLALAAFSARRSGAPYPGRWALLATLFFYISLDETVELH